MPGISAFQAHSQRYEAWFARHKAAYLSELFAVRALLPWSGRGLEIGVGSGPFAAPLGVQVGVDPTPAMLALAAARGIEVVVGTAEQLPFPPARFDYALVVTTLCFVDSPARMLAEAHRVLKPNGSLVIGSLTATVRWAGTIWRTRRRASFTARRPSTPPPKSNNY